MRILKNDMVLSEMFYNIFDQLCVFMTYEGFK